ncbi:lysosome-associated membrane glycoprotein 5 isoform 3 [Camelus ferus]|nr:lysosome-associated membrane glycoprotein 5 isoform 3 [Camelus ferus]
MDSGTQRRPQLLFCRRGPNLFNPSILEIDPSPLALEAGVDLTLRLSRTGGAGCQAPGRSAHLSSGAEAGRSGVRSPSPTKLQTLSDQAQIPRCRAKEPDAFFKSRDSSGVIPSPLNNCTDTMAGIMGEQEVENLSGLSTNPEKDIFVVRENGTTCLMAEFAAKFIVPYNVWASNSVDLLTEQADISLTRGAEVKGRCGHNESELQQESHNMSKGPEAMWRLSKVQFVYDSSEKTHFKDAVDAGKHTANSHHLSALVTPAGKSYECQAQQTISLASSDSQKTITMILSAVHIQPFDIISDFVFSEEHKCPVDEREQLEETLPLILGLILGFVIVVTLVIYHIHHKMTANQVQIPRDRSQYKHMG